MTTVYRSKTDAWLIAALAIASIASLSAAMTVLSASSPSTGAIAGSIAIVGFGVGLPLWLLLSTRYTLGRSQLVVRSGPFKWNILISEITGITPSNNPLSGPALSLDRLRIDYGRGYSLMVSPSDKDQFIRDIETARRNAAQRLP